MAVKVTFGGANAVGLNVVDDETIQCVTPAKNAGQVDVVVTTSVGQATLPNGFSYVSGQKPTITACVPNRGGTAGGTDVSIIGQFFTGFTQVLFGTQKAVNPVLTFDSQIDCKTPAGSGVVDVTVATPVGRTIKTGAFSYTDSSPERLPETNVSPLSPRWDENLTIKGSGWEPNGNVRVVVTGPNGNETHNVTLSTSSTGTVAGTLLTAGKEQMTGPYKLVMTQGDLRAEADYVCRVSARVLNPTLTVTPNSAPVNEKMVVNGAGWHPQGGQVLLTYKSSSGRIMQSLYRPVAPDGTCFMEFYADSNPRPDTCTLIGEQGIYKAQTTYRVTA